VSAVSLLERPERPRLGEVTWTTSLCECLFCGMEWQSVHRHGVEIECPGCEGRDVVRTDGCEMAKGCKKPPRPPGKR
jgi:hypothetical protein